MSLRLRFEIKLNSDYHVGAGYGRGTELDSALLRDADGVPVLRGTMLNGLLRDSLWRLLQLPPLSSLQRCQASGKQTTERYCGQYTTGAQLATCPICRLFGTPRTMKRWRIGSARPVAQPAVADTPYAPNELPGQSVMRVRVSPHTRRAAPNKLFSEEQGGEQTFAFTITCPTADETALDEAALWVAAARFVRQLGRSRRRGQGECLITLQEVEGATLGNHSQETLLRRFAARWLGGANIQHNQPALKTLEAAVLPSVFTQHRARFRLLARLDEPVIIAKRAAAGNRFQSRVSIPGKTIRGALADLVAHAYDLDDDKTYAAFVTLFLRDGARFPTLYPLYENAYPAVSVPRDGFACKIYRDHAVQWGTQQQSIEKCGDCGGRTKGLREGFYPLRSLQAQTFNPKRRTEMHIRIDPKSGRVKTGQLFDYVALEAGQYFAGELACADEALWKLLQNFTGLQEKQVFALRLGKATRRGYGKVSLWVQRVTEDEAPAFEVQQSLTERVPLGAKDVTLMLLTDTIVTDDWGRFVTGFDNYWLNQQLRIPVSVVDGTSFVGKRVVDGFNVQWRLPAWRAMALTAGSTVRLHLAQPVTAETLAKFHEQELEGIGERRNEGYGRVVFNHPVQCNLAGLSGTLQSLPKEMALATQPGKKTVPELTREWRKTLEDAIQTEARRWRKAKGLPYVALARWLDANRYRDVAALIEELTLLGIADEKLKTLIRGPGYRTGEDEYGEREQQNRFDEIQGLSLVKELLRKLYDKSQDFWPLGIEILADYVADFAGL